MPVLDNSPVNKRIRWCDIQVVYKDDIYTVKDGYTDCRYVYWDLRYPNEFLSSNELPYEYIDIVYINNGGVHTIYPNIDISVIDSNSYKLKSEYLSKSVASLREYTTNLGNKADSNEDQILSIRDMLVSIDERLKALESKRGSDLNV